MLKRIKAVRGIERKRHFENGGTLIEWRGGTRTVTKNKKKEAKTGLPPAFPLNRTEKMSSTTHQN